MGVELENSLWRPKEMRVLKEPYILAEAGDTEGFETK